MTIVRAALKRLHSPDVFDLENYWPADATCFGILVQAMFGPVDAEGEESFELIICNPKWLERQIAIKGIIVGIHHLIVDEYDFKAIRDFLSSYAQKCEGKSWQAVAALLSKIGRWEYEDYRT